MSHPVTTILIVDDEIRNRRVLEALLAPEGYRTLGAANGEEALASVAQSAPDLILLDVMMPGMEGFEVLRQLRRRSAVPVIMLTARTEHGDRIEGLNAGADDYLPKPFSPDELLARIQAVLRRAGRGPALKAEVLEANGIKLNSNSREVHREGELVEITSIEYDILEVLVRSAGRVVSRDDLARFLYNRQANPLERALDVHVSHLRKKLERGRPLIRTVRGVGYLFASEETGA